MNYEEARQLGAKSDAPGKWNWSNRNDDRISTASPCAWPDFEWPPLDPTDPWGAKVTPTGRERCDHDTREEAERHQYDAALTKVTIDLLILDDIHQRRRCDAPDCREWETHRANWHDGYRFDHLCDDDADVAVVAVIHPFVPGMSRIHS